MGDWLAVERPLLESGHVVVGLDEVGRGALAGPVTVGAVALSRVIAPPEGLADSKELTPRRRENLVEPLCAWATAWSLGSSSAQEIDQWGLRLALAVAATRALEGLAVRPTHALVDGTFNLLRAPTDVPFGVEPPPPLLFADLAASTIVKGDRICATIAAASVLAKVHRDGVMAALGSVDGRFGWAANKGYGAPDHLSAIARYGATVEHRRSWRLPGAGPS